MAIIPAPMGATHDLGGTRFTSLVTPSRGSSETAAWFVEIDPDAPATPHSLTREEVFVVLAGTADVTLGGERGRAGVGDSIVVPADVSFEVSNAGDDTLKMLCMLPVGGQANTGTAIFTPPWAE